MHLLIPFAYCSSEDCAAALRSLRLPYLEKLLLRLTPQPLDAGDEFSLSPPHERALARALGLSVADGLLPWAARQAQAAGGWGFITPCHWQMGTNHVTLRAAALPDFPAQESHALLAAMQPYFQEDGITLRYDQPTRWLARSETFRSLATASLDRVAGHDVANWLPRGAGAAALQRLQSEIQMLLYSHPVNEARAARGAPPVNSFWLSGTGALPQRPATSTADAQPVLVSALREAALCEDWAAWAQAWAMLDSTECAALLATLGQNDSGQLTLCGERNAQTFGVGPQALFKRFTNLFGTQPLSTVLEPL